MKATRFPTDDLGDQEPDPFDLSETSTYFDRLVDPAGWNWNQLGKVSR